MKRRALLAACVAATASATAGCLSTFEDDPQIPVLLDVTANNRTDERVAVDVRVENDGEIIVEKRDDIEPRDGSRVYGFRVDCEWPAEPTPLTVRARVEGGEWSVVETAKYETDCLAAIYDVRDRGDDVGIDGAWFTTTNCGEARDGCPQPPEHPT